MTNSGVPWLTILAAIPLLGALVVWALPAARAELAKWVGVAFALAAAGLTAALCLGFETGGPRFQFTERYGWIPRFGISYAMGVDGIALVLIALTAVLTPLCIMAVRPALLQPESTRQASAASAETPVGELVRSRATAHLVALMLVLEALLIGVFAATDVVLFYILFEAMLIPMYLLIGQFGGPQRSYAAMKFLLYSLAGGLVLLVAVLVLGAKGPGGDQGFLFDKLVGLDLSQGTQRWLFLGFFIAFAIKAPLVPVHTWLPSAAAEAPAPAAVLMVAVMDKVGTFAMMRYCLELFPEASRWAAPVVVIVSVVGIIYGALLAIGQVDLGRFIAYTSVSHFGFITLGIFALTTQAHTGAVFYMVNHGLSTGLLFLLAGMLVARRGSRMIGDYRGLARLMPALSGMFLIAALATIALPGLATFISEFLVLLGSYQTYPVQTIVATAGVILAAVYMLLLYQRMMTGQPAGVGEAAVDASAPAASEAATAVADTTDSPTPVDAPAAANHQWPDLSATERWVLAPMVALLIGLGFFPKPLLELVKPAVAATMQAAHASDPAPVVHVGVAEPVGQDPTPQPAAPTPASQPSPLNPAPQPSPLTATPVPQAVPSPQPAPPLEGSQP